MRNEYEREAGFQREVSISGIALAHHAGEVATMRDFNTAGPVRPDEHYCIPALGRVDLPKVLALIRRRRYFILHAPRQTGKTSTLLALRDLLNSGSAGHYRCVHVNVEPGQSAREDVGQAMGAILDGLAKQLRRTLGDSETAALAESMDTSVRSHSVLGRVLTSWSEHDAAPAVLIIDEIDSLVGDTLVSVLRQLRAGYSDRSGGFPQSVILSGVRDVRDYRIRASSEKDLVAGGSAFNIKAKSLRLGDFDRSEVTTLLGQHTAATGQEFAPRAVAAVWEQTRGQPWLVNALAQEMCFQHVGRPRRLGRPVNVDDVFEAREALIRRRETHIDQLADKLREPRVRRVIEPLLSGGNANHAARDLEYVRDLGLVALDSPLRIANPIYTEVVPRELTSVLQDDIRQQAAWYVGRDGGLDMNRLLAAFQEFFRENSEHWIQRARYTEAGPQLVLQAFLHRVVNAKGRIEREYALGSRRVDLLVVWPAGQGREDRFVVECKLLRSGRARTLGKGLEQTADYMDLSGTDKGHLVLFDMRGGISWEERVFREEHTHGGKRITVWGA